MANEAVEVVSKPLEGLVATIVSERELAINIGSDHGVTRGMKFKVLTGSPTEITDPQTGEKLGAISRTKVRVMAELVLPKFSVCKTYRTYRTGSTLNAGLSHLFAPSRTVTETLRAEDADYVPELSEEESFVKKGDKVEQILEGNLVTIQDVENVLKNAVLRGALNKATVEKSVEGWKQADAALQEAQAATQDREQKIETALKQYNSYTSEVTHLYNRAQPDEVDD